MSRWFSPIPPRIPSITLASVVTVASAAASSLSDPSRRAPMTRSVSSVTTHSIPATVPVSSLNGL